MKWESSGLQENKVAFKMASKKANKIVEKAKEVAWKEVEVELEMLRRERKSLRMGNAKNKASKNFTQIKQKKNSKKTKNK